MAADLVRFVDKIDAAPTTRLDLNDETSWWVKSLSAPPPRLRRSVSSNAMRDGVNVASALYDSRTVTLVLESRKSTQDLAATEIQKLWRELDRTSNYLMYQPQGATKPVFFKLYRSDASQLEDVVAQAAMRTITVELLAEPFALGLRETLGPFTVNNDPAAGSNGLYFDVSSVLGDVAAEPVLWWTATTALLYVSVTHTPSAPALVWSQAESLTLGTDTTNPGGVADAGMSGSGSNNYRRTTFATATMQTRLTASSLVARGSWRVLVAVRRDDSTSVIRARWSVSTPTLTNGPTTEVTATTSRQILDLGVVTLHGQSPDLVGEGATLNSLTLYDIRIQAERVSGSGGIDWDYVLLLPVGDQVGEAAANQMLLANCKGTSPLLDSTRDVVSHWSGGDPSVGTSATIDGNASLAGALPLIYPGLTNRFHVVHSYTSHAKATTLTVNGAYWPRYLFVRPSAT